MTALDPSAIIPIRAVPPEPETRRVAVGIAEAVVSLCVNLAVLAGLVHLAFPPARPLPTPNTISVELVPEPPQPKPAEAASAKAETKPEATVKEPSPPAASAEPPQQKGADTKPEAAAKPPEAAAAPPENPSPPPGTPTPPPEPAGGAPDKVAATQEPAEVPPSIDAGTDPTPHLVEAPPAPDPAAAQSEKNQAANAEAQPAKVDKPTEAPPAAAPDVLASTSPDAEPAPRPASTPEGKAAEKATTPEEIREAENTAKLAAALPYAQNFLPEVNRATVSGPGASDAKSYRGAVYGAFHKADDIVAAAREKNLRGQAVVVFTIDAKGALTREAIALTSGNPEVDRVALEIVRRAAPYPPPPPGGQRTFSPAIALGLD